MHTIEFRSYTFLPPALSLLLAGAVAVSAQSPRAQLRQGIDDYRQEQYEAAIRAFTEAGQAAEIEKLDPAVALFNKGNTYYRKGDYEQALARYEDALRSENLRLNEAAHFNRGNSFVARAQRLEEEGQAESAIDLLEQALKSYEDVLMLNPADRDAKINHELAARQKERLEQWLEEQPPPPPQPEPGDTPEEEPEAPDEPDRPEPDEAPPEDAPDEIAGATETPAEEPELDVPEDVTLEEAMMILDSLKEEEELYRQQMRQQHRRPADVGRDW